MDDHKLFIFEVETGLIDGWYAPNADMDSVRIRWDSRRPEYTHMICLTKERIKYKRIPPHKYMRGRLPETNDSTATK